MVTVLMLLFELLVRSGISRELSSFGRNSQTDTVISGWDGSVDTSSVISLPVKKISFVYFSTAGC